MEYETLDGVLVGDIGDCEVVIKCCRPCALFMRDNYPAVDCRVRDQEWVSCVLLPLDPTRVCNRNRCDNGDLLFIGINDKALESLRPTVAVGVMPFKLIEHYPREYCSTFEHKDFD